ncbi:MAG TPA: NAD(P)H-dependent oxidoreductase [Duganella sp.]|uniref:NADPH-dependent FMN reductase n=1 Tax=Duganella sp. TaxID=1904440 RepID=UPI002ED43DCC
MLRIAVIIGSTRPNRFAEFPTQWLLEGASKRSDFELEMLDLRLFGLPFLEEGIPPSFLHGVYLSQRANEWRQYIGQYDGFIITAAEYNHGPTAVLKNAFDSAYAEWKKKPVSFVGYGHAGGTRAIEQLRSVAVGLEMAPVYQEVNIVGEQYRAIANREADLNDFADLVQARTLLFDNMVWWAQALKAARETPD